MNETIPSPPLLAPLLVLLLPIHRVAKIGDHYSMAFNATLILHFDRHSFTISSLNQKIQVISKNIDPVFAAMFMPGFNIYLDNVHINGLFLY